MPGTCPVASISLPVSAAGSGGSQGGTAQRPPATTLSRSAVVCAPSSSHAVAQPPIPAGINSGSGWKEGRGGGCLPAALWARQGSPPPAFGIDPPQQVGGDIPALCPARGGY